jgi:5-methylcytosine-specific restriction protein B
MDLKTARSVIEEICADRELQKELLRCLSQSIRAAHRNKPAAWSLSIQAQPKLLRLIVGRLFTISLRPGSIHLIVDSTALDAEAMAVLQGEATEEGKGEFATAPTIDWYRLSHESLPRIWSIIMGAHLAAIEKAAEGVTSRTPVFHGHSPAALQVVADTIGEKLPTPEYGEDESSEDMLDKLLDLVRQRFPDWDGFSNPGFEEEEVNYKQAAVKLCKEQFGEQELRRLQAEGNFDEIINRLDTIGKHNNLLYRSVPSTGDLGILYKDDLDKEGFAAVVIDLLYGDGNSPARLARYLGWVDDHGLPSKWTFPTYFLFLCHPESEIFVKPSVITEFFSLIGQEEKFWGKPKVSQYSLVLDVAKDLAGALEQYSPRDMIDIQSLMWVCVSVSKKEALQQEEEEEETGRVREPQTESYQSEAQIFFTPRTFELLEGLHKEPKRDFYAAHKEEFQNHLESPFHGLFEAIISNLRSEILDRMETEKSLYGRIPKNDYGRGGAWPFYWGAIYPKGQKRIEGAQLYAWMNHETLRFGFSLGRYSSDAEERFTRNVRTYQDPLIEYFQARLPAEAVHFSASSEADWRPGDGFAKDQSWAQWPKAVKEGRVQIRKVLTPDQVLSLDREALASELRVVFETLYPLALLTVEDDPKRELFRYLEIEEGFDETNPFYPLEQCSAEIGIAVAQLSRWIRAIERKGQAIFYGPPGTGKTFVAEKLADHIIGGGTGFQELVQFHPSYSYEDFIQGIRPQVTKGGALTYDLVAGRFLDFCDRAKGTDDPCVLIVDEINRANLSRVFGELMYLLEYRKAVIPLAGGRNFHIPRNVRIIGTMNTADRSIALVDHALRRRFAFLALRPMYEVLEKYHAETGYPVERLVAVLRQVNNEINDSHYEVGISFFLRKDLDRQIEDVWRMEIEPYLEEYFFDQGEKVDAFRWTNIGERLKP